MKIYTTDFDYSLDWQKKYTGFNLLENEQILGEIQDGEGRSIKDIWKPIKAAWYLHNKPKAKPLDFTLAGIPKVFGLTQRAVDILADLLTFGELLPVDTSDGPVYLYNPPHPDALDEAESVFKKYDDGRFDIIELHSFYEEKLQDIHLFKIPGQPYYYHYCTEEFKDRCKEHKLLGIDFRLVWDSENPDFRDERFSPEHWAEIKEKLLVKKGLAEPVVPAVPVAPTPKKYKPSERPLNAEDYPDMLGAMEAALEFIDQVVKKKLALVSEPKAIVEAIYETFNSLGSVSLNSEEKIDRGLELGLLWGEQFVRAYKWQWLYIHDIFAITPENRAFYIHPGDAFDKLFETQNATNTALLLFNMMGIPERASLYGQAGDYTEITPS
jgi:hypothetical protein